MKLKNKAVIILIILLLVSIIIIFTFFKKDKIEYKILASDIILDTKEVDIVSKDNVGDHPTHIDHSIFVDLDGKKVEIERLDFAGYNEEIVDQVFSYNGTNNDFLVFTTYWDTENRALGLYGLFYRVYVYDTDLKPRLDIKSYFIPGYDDETDGGYFEYEFKTKDLIIQKLQELEKEGKF